VVADRRHGPWWSAALAFPGMLVADPVRAPGGELMGMGAAGQCHKGEKAVVCWKQLKQPEVLQAFPWAG